MVCRETKMLLTRFFPVDFQATRRLLNMSTSWLREKSVEVVFQCYFGREIERVPVKFGDVRVLLLWFKQA